MAIPGTPGASVPPGEDWLVRRVADLERRLNELAAADPLRTAGIEVTGPDAVTVDGSLKVDGTMTVDGNATFNGAMAIAGTLSLPAGIIDNEALANPVSIGNVALNDSNLAYGTTYLDYAVATVNIPAGFTKVTVFANGAGRCLNDTAAPQYFFGQTFGQSSAGGEYWGSVQQTTLAAGYQGTLSASLACSFTVAATPGQWVKVFVKAKATAAIGAAPGNFVGVDAVFLFTR